MGYQTILLKDCGGTKTLSILKMGQETFTNCVKLSGLKMTPP